MQLPTGIQKNGKHEIIVEDEVMLVGAWVLLLFLRFQWNCFQVQFRRKMIIKTFWKFDDVTKLKWENVILCFISILLLTKTISRILARNIFQSILFAHCLVFPFWCVLMFYFVLFFKPRNLVLTILAMSIKAPKWHLSHINGFSSNFTSPILCNLTV